MSGKVNHLKIGGFVIGAVVLLLGGLFLLGARDLFRPEWLVEIYFDETVQGLDVGSPVKYRGVQIGSVKEISFVYESYSTDASYVMVRAAVDPCAMGASSPSCSEDELRRGLAVQVAKGFRMYLAIQGLTGTAYLEGDYLNPARNPPLPIDWTPQHMYIPSARSAIRRMGQSLDRVLNNLSDVDFQRLGSHLDSVLVSMTNVIESGLTPALVSLTRATDEVPQNLRGINNEVQALLMDLRPAVSNAALAAEGLPETVQRLNQISRRIDQWLGDQGGDLAEIVENVKQVTGDLQEISDRAREYPSQIWFGDPPPKTGDGQ